MDTLKMLPWHKSEGMLDIWSCVFRSKFPGDILDVNSPEVVPVSYLISLAFF